MPTNEYFVEWSILLKASSPEEAAKKARAIQRDPESRANHFEVTDETGGMVEVNV